MKPLKNFETFLNEGKAVDSKIKDQIPEDSSDLMKMLWWERTKFEHINTPNPWWKKFISPTKNIVTTLSPEEKNALVAICKDASKHMMELYKKNPKPEGYGNRKGQSETWKKLADKIESTGKIDSDEMCDIAMEIIDISSSVINKHFKSKETGTEAARRAGIIGV